MRNKIKVDKLRRRLSIKYYLKRNILKNIIYNSNISKRIRFIANIKINKLNKNTSLVRIKNRCVLSSKPRSNFRKFKLSRIKVKELAGFNLINGLRKSSY